MDNYRLAQRLYVIEKDIYDLLAIIRHKEIRGEQNDQEWYKVVGNLRDKLKEEDYVISDINSKNLMDKVIGEMSKMVSINEIVLKLKLVLRIKNIQGIYKKDGIDLEILKIISSLYRDILLSFYDEKIYSGGNFEDTKYYLALKYDYIYENINLRVDEEIIRRNFRTDYSLYLDEQITSVLHGISYRRVAFEKFRYGLSIFEKENILAKEIINSSLSEADKKNLLDVCLYNIRTAILLFDENEFANFYDEMFEGNDPLTKDIDGRFDVDVAMILKKDRERHKKLSIILTK